MNILEQIERIENFWKVLNVDAKVFCGGMVQETGTWR